ncbi:MAG: cytochrome c oxidase assembly protein [Roseiarcus sp.]
MERTWLHAPLTSRWAAERTGLAADWAVVAFGVFLFWISESYPSLMPVWAPWDFSPLIYLATALTLLWFFRGMALARPQERPPVWRRAVFVIGLLGAYAVLQTRFEYWSQHMFFLNRIQHVAMHHLSPLLIALSWVGGTVKRGMPRWARRPVESRFAGAAIHVLQQPLLAAFLFVGLFYFWLIPAVHFRAMIDARLYALMNWSMVLDGILFWCLVLDPRPKPPARVSFGARAALSLGVMFPQILLGAIIVFSSRDLYPYYNLCGRIFPSISALDDQQLGGLVIWIPPAMMSVVGVLVVVNAMRLNDESIAEIDENAAALAAASRRWTGL